jgi:hypothetical protein
MANNSIFNRQLYKRYWNIPNEPRHIKDILCELVKKYSKNISYYYIKEDYYIHIYIICDNITDVIYYIKYYKYKSIKTGVKYINKGTFRYYKDNKNIYFIYNEIIIKYYNNKKIYEKSNNEQIIYWSPINRRIYNLPIKKDNKMPLNKEIFYTDENDVALVFYIGPLDGIIYEFAYYYINNYYYIEKYTKKNKYIIISSWRICILFI